MSLTRTAPTVAAGDEPSAAVHRDLLLAADELLQARFNERSWLVFTCAPQLELGDVFIFGTPDNLSISGTAYDPADEDPPNPTPGDVVSTDSSTQVIWLTGYSDPLTLNRRTVDYDPGTGTETWWVGTIRPERWEPLRVADLCVEDYVDPVATLTSVFTWRSHWDKYGCIRIHNGNRFALTLEFEGATQAAVEIPPYGILCGRRTTLGGAFAWDSHYVHLTAEDDPLTWVKRHQGQFAASMELLTDLVDGLGAWARFAPVLDADSTAREQGNFTGAAPAGTDYLWDWLWHRGTLLSVVLDRRDGTTTIEELTWNGIGSIPDPTWSGHVAVDIDLVDTIRFESDVTPPAGATDEEWEHDLIPISSNLTGGAILALQPGSVTLLPIAAGDAAGHYTAPLALGTIQAGTTTVYSPESGGATTALLNQWSLSETGGLVSFLDSLLNDYAPAPSSGTTGLSKSFGAIGRWGITSSSASSSMSEFSDALLDQVKTDGSLMEWLTARYISLADRRRFLARYPRKYHAAGEEVGGVAVYDSHPQDSHVLGTPDGLGGAIGVTLKPVLTSPVQIEGNPWTRQASDRGTELWVPADLLHTVAKRIRETGWWAANRDRILAGTFEPEDQLIAWRIPRMIDEWNALARAINAVQEVFRADIRHLHKDPIPTDIVHPPFSYLGEAPWAVPADWICGRHDDGTLFDWATAWGVVPLIGVPDLDTLAAIDLVCWQGNTNASGEIVEFVKEDASVLRPGEVITTVHGYGYSSWKALSPSISRKLFGGAGDWSDYVYITQNSAEAVFDALGVPVMPPPVGERYNPVIEEDASLSVLTGVLGTGPVAGSPVDVSDAMTAYRLPTSSGSWLQVWDGEMAGIQRVGFRMIDAYGYGELRLALDPIAGETDWVTIERNVSADCRDNGPLAPRSKVVQTSAGSYTLASGYVALANDAWRSGTEAYSTTPFLLIGAPELWSEFAWDSPIQSDHATDPSPESQFSITDYAPSSGGLKHMEFLSGSVTPAMLRSNDWHNHGAYHCQVVQRTGVLRA